MAISLDGFIDGLRHEDAKPLENGNALLGYVWEGVSAWDGIQGDFCELFRPLAPHFHEEVSETYTVIRGSGKLFRGFIEVEMTPGEAPYEIPARTEYAVIPHAGESLWLRIVCTPDFDPLGWKLVDLSGDIRKEQSWRSALWDEAADRQLPRYTDLSLKVLVEQLHVSRSWR